MLGLPVNGGPFPAKIEDISGNTSRVLSGVTGGNARIDCAAASSRVAHETGSMTEVLMRARRPGVQAFIARLFMEVYRSDPLYVRLPRTLECTRSFFNDTPRISEWGTNFYDDTRTGSEDVSWNITSAF